MRVMNRSEQYLHERIKKIVEANPTDEFAYGVAMAALSEEVGRAVGLMIGESNCPQAFNAFTEAVLAKVAEFAANKTQAIRLTPPRGQPISTARAAINAALEAARAASERPRAAALEPILPQAVAAPRKGPRRRKRSIRLMQTNPNRPEPVGPNFLTPEQLFTARLDKNKTQKMLADALNVPPKYISWLESGKYVAKAELYTRLRSVLGIRPGVANG